VDIGRLASFRLEPLSAPFTRRDPLFARVVMRAISTRAAAGAGEEAGESEIRATHMADERLDLPPRDRSGQGR